MKTASLFFVLALLLSASCSKKQTNQDAQKESIYIERTAPVDSLLLKKADSLMLSGRMAYSKRDLVQSGKDLHLADSILKSQGQWSLVVRNLINIISVAQATKQSQDSITVSINDIQKIVDKLPENDWNSGLFYKKKAGIVNANKYHLDSKFYALKALNIFLSYPKTKETALQTQAINRILGSLEIDLSNFERGISYYKKAIETGECFNLSTSFSYAQIFYVYSVSGNDMEASKLIDFIDENNLLDDSLLFLSFDYYGDCSNYYLKKKQYKKALQMLDKQNELIDSSPYKVHFTDWFQDQVEAAIYTEMGNYSKSITILNAITIEDDTYTITSFQDSTNNYLLANNYLLLGEIDKYMYYIQKAINFHLPSKANNTSFFDTADFANSLSKEKLLSLLQSKSSFCLKQYKNTGEAKFKKIALQTFKQQHSVINSIGAISEEDTFIQKFNYKKLYDDYFSLLHEDWSENPTQEHFYKALAIADQSKGNVVLGEIKKMQKERLFKNIPQDLLQREQALQYTLDTISIVARGKVYSEKIDSLTRELESVKQILKTDHRKYYQLSYGTDKSIESILQEHFKGDNVVSFLVGEQYVYVLNQRGNTQVFDKIEFNKERLAEVEDYLKSIRMPGEQNHEALEKSLYDTLFKAYSKADDRTVLSLDDVLHLLPVEGIISNYSNNRSQSFVRVNNISTYQKFESNSKSNPLIFAPFAKTKNTKRQLPGTLKEANNIKNAIGGSIKMNTDATKEVFLNQAKTSGIIHIATHASVNVKSPLKSTIYFSETLDQEPSETQLQLKELYGLRLDNELVTLSACETGLGKEIKGKGLQSISNAFAYAGVGSTVMSLWQVPDAQTEQIMTTFYTNLKNGQEKDVALQNSKEAYLQSVNDEALKHPYYWAGFVISGDVVALDISNPELNYLKIGGILLLLVIGIFSLIKIRKRTS